MVDHPNKENCQFLGDVKGASLKELRDELSRELKDQLHHEDVQKYIRTQKTPEHALRQNRLRESTEVAGIKLKIAIQNAKETGNTPLPLPTCSTG